MNKFRIALAAMIVALAAVSAIDSASAFRAGGAPILYVIGDPFGP
jgi:hypothetical protein